MIEVSEIIESLSGKYGGMYGFGLFTGLVLAGGFWQKHIVQMHINAFEALKAECLARDQKHSEKIERLETRVQTLETEKFQMAINMGLDR